MKSPAIPLLAVLFLLGCDKTEEKKGGVTAAPKPEERLKPSTSPPPEAAPEKPAPQSAELDAFYADVDALEKKAALVLKKAETEVEGPEVAALEATCDELIKRRTQLMSGFTLNQKKEVAKRSIAVSQVRKAVMEMRFAKPGATPDAGLPEALSPTPVEPAAPKGNEKDAPPSRRNGPVVPQ